MSLSNNLFFGVNAHKKPVYGFDISNSILSKLSLEDVLNVLSYFCNGLSEEQICRISYFYNKDEKHKSYLCGVSKAIGRSVYMPLLIKSDMDKGNVIDKAGYNQLASSGFNRSFDNIWKTYQWEKFGK